MVLSPSDPTKASKKIPARKWREHHRHAVAVYPSNSSWTPWLSSTTSMFRTQQCPVATILPFSIGPAREQKENDVHCGRGMLPSVLRPPRRKSRARPRPVATVPPFGIGPVKELNENDVLCGRGAAINLHKGNIDYRETVKKYKKIYLAASTKKMDKPFIAAEIVQQIRNMNPPGRFLKQESNGVWYDIGDTKAIKKVGQQLREDAPKIRENLDNNEDSCAKSGGEITILEEIKARNSTATGGAAAVGAEQPPTQQKKDRITPLSRKTPRGESLGTSDSSCKSTRSSETWVPHNQVHQGRVISNETAHLAMTQVDVAVNEGVKTDTLETGQAAFFQDHSHPAIPPFGIGPVKELNENDVLCGRGAVTNMHKGNIDYRETVKKYKKIYLAASTKKMDKPFIAAEIVQQIRNMNPPGRFLKQEANGEWYDIGDTNAIKKVGQQLREDAPKIREKLDNNEESSAKGDEDITILEEIKARCSTSFGEATAVGARQPPTHQNKDKTTPPSRKTPRGESLGKSDFSCKSTRSSEALVHQNQAHKGRSKLKATSHLTTMQAGDQATFFQNHTRPAIFPCFNPAGAVFRPVMPVPPAANPSIFTVVSTRIPVMQIFARAKDSSMAD